MTPRRIGEYTRITKTAARKRWAAGLPVIACPVNLDPASPWKPVVTIPAADQTDPFPHSFDFHANCITMQYCINSETGRYLAYYVEEV